MLRMSLGVGFLHFLHLKPDPKIVPVEDEGSRRIGNGLEFDVASQRHASHVPGVRFLHFRPDPEAAFKDSGHQDDPGRTGTRFTTFLEIRFAYLDTPTSPLKAKPMTHKNPKKRAIILRLPESLVDRLDTVVSDLQMPSRSYYLRRSIERALDFSEAREIPLFNDLNALGNPLR
jgi:hypothetical protein